MLVSELAGSYDLLVPMMLAIGVAFVALRRWTLYPAQPRSQRDSPAHPELRARDLLVRVRAQDVAAPVETGPLEAAARLPAGVTAAALTHRQRLLPLRGAGGAFTGLADVDAIRAAATDPDLAWAVLADVAAPFVSVPPDATLARVGELLAEHGLRQLPVVEGGRIVGYVGEAENRARVPPGRHRAGSRAPGLGAEHSGGWTARRGAHGAPLRRRDGGDAAQARGLRPRRRHPERRADRPGRLGRLAVLAALRLRRLLRGAARHAGPRAVGARARGEVRASRRRYRPGTLVLETELETADGAVRIVDFMPPPTVPRTWSASSRGCVGACRCGSSSPRASATACAGRGYPRRRRHLSLAAGPDTLELHAPVAVRRGRRGPGRARGRAGRPAPLRARLAPLARAAARAAGRPRRARGDRGVLDGVVRPLPGRGRLARGGGALAGHPEGAHRLGHRRHRGRADHLAPRAARRRPQLGLPLLLDPRRDLHAARAHGGRLRGRGARLARLAAPRGGGRPGRPADHVRPRRGAAAHRARAPWLPGYGGARPVRIGNAACGQLQLDVYGEVLDCLHHARSNGLAYDQDAWALQRALLDWLEGHWDDPDEGIWEVRGPRQDFTHSKVMAWVAVDRAVRCADGTGLPGPVERWRALRDAIHEDVCRRGY